MSMAPGWVNWLTGAICLLMAINFFAQAYGLKVGAKPLNLNDLPKYEPRVQDGIVPSVPLNQRF